MLITLLFLLAVLLFVYAVLLKIGKQVAMCFVSVVSLSLLFWADGWLMLILPALALLTWGITKLMSREKGLLWQRIWLIVGILVQLAPLLLFKYGHAWMRLGPQMFSSDFILNSVFMPLGISFYVFRGVSYCVDVYEKRCPNDVTFLEYLAFITFFPFLVAGPVVRAVDFIPQMRSRKQIDGTLLYSGLFLLLSGIIKKAIADHIGVFNNWVFDTPEAYSGIELSAAVLGFSMQVYADFSAYSDISIGVAAMLGFRIRDNFSFPYRATNVTSFWHRWHISLSTWFRDYVYIPLGGNRHGKARMAAALLVTMLLAGIWHGTGWLFAAWGLWHGLGLVFHKVLQPWLRKIPDIWCVKAVSWAVTFVFLCLGWLIFRAGSVDDLCYIAQHLFDGYEPQAILAFLQARLSWCILVMAVLLSQILQRRHVYMLQARFVWSSWLTKLIIILIVLQILIQLNQINIEPFIYNQF